MFSSQNSQVSNDVNYIEDVFSTYLYTGTGSSRTITNGIDLSTYGGLVWTKGRSYAYNHWLIDTVRGNTQVIKSNTTNADQSLSGGGGAITSFNTNGYGVNLYDENNSNAKTFVSWTFRKQPKFFDVVTWTGDGTSGRTISHSLGSAPACVFVKRTNSDADWAVYHRSLSESASYSYNLFLNGTYAQANDSLFGLHSQQTSTQFKLGSNANAALINNSGDTYVAYLFAHNAGGFGLTGTDNVISCGSYTGNGSATGPVVTLGYEPQWVMVKRATVSTGSWEMYDSMRGFTMEADAVLRADTSGAEFSLQRINPTSTGFQLADSDGDVNANGSTYIYIAIRRGPMKVPTDATKVFAPFYASYSEGAAITTDFPIDLSMWKGDVTYNWSWQDRLRGTPTSTGSGGPSLASNSNASETTSYTAVGITKLDSNTRGSVSYQADSSRSNAAAYFMLRRSPSFFDEVCYTGTGSATTVTHNLGVPPELWIVKKRSSGTNRPWRVGYGSGTTYMAIDSSDPAYASSNPWNNTAPTSSVFTVGVENATNESSATFVSYLFATCAGVSKVGSYTGNGSTQTINCGFTGGARFVMIKQTSGSGGDWYVYSSALGIVAGNDRTVLFNSSSSSSAFGDTLDAFASGFELGPNSASFGNNTNGETYIFLAIA